MSQVVQPARMFLNQDMQLPLVESCLEGQVAVFTARCPGKESANEDSAAVIEVTPELAVLAVADGLGGGPEGEKASRLALQTLRREIQATITDGVQLRTAILNGFEAANQEVLRSARGAATTLAVAEIREGVFRPYHVGDSVILLMSNRGRIKHESISHSPVGYGIESGLLDKDEALYHEERHLVSNVIGSEEMRIEVGPEVVLASRDTILVASDGLVDNLTVAEITERARKGDLAQGIQRLAKDAQQRMKAKVEDRPSKPDDLTMVMFRPSSVHHPGEEVQSPASCNRLEGDETPSSESVADPS